ncbi:hypothetical protein WJX84_008020 [Apatococcus fuscideae]|uniref:Myb-like domain-containing protein n=1 Tax=Apatococcus fuscideae TaxID=2026836 RepID=A0AAW1TCL6_9CHLO
MQQPLSDEALDELDAFDFDLSDENSELDWVPEDSPSPGEEHSGGAGAVPFNPQQNTGTASQAQATKTQAPSGGHNGFQEQDPFDQLLHQLSSNVADGQMESENEQGPPLEEDYEYEAFLKVLRGEADMDLPEDDLEDEDFTIDLEELLQLSEAPSAGDLGAPMERRLTRASWRPAALPPARRKHGPPKVARIRAKPKARPLGATIVQQARQGKLASQRQSYAVPPLTMPLLPNHPPPPLEVTGSQVAQLYQQVAQHMQLLVQASMLLTQSPHKQALRGYLSSLLSQLQGFVSRQVHARQASQLEPLSPIALGLCSGPEWLKAHAVVVAPAATDGGEGAEREPAYFLRPVWSHADVPPVSLLPQLLAAFGCLMAAPAQPAQSPEAASLQMAYTGMLPFFDPDLLPCQGPDTRPGAWMPAEDDLLVLGVRRFGHEYEQIRRALVPVHPVYDIIGRWRLNNSSETRSRCTLQAEDLVILGIKRYGADYGRIRSELLPTRAEKDISAEHRRLFRLYGSRVFEEASLTETAGLNASEVGTIASALQQYGPDPRRWELIAQELPERKPHTLARLWARYTSGATPSIRKQLNNYGTKTLQQPPQQATDTAPSAGSIPLPPTSTSGIADLHSNMGWAQNAEGPLSRHPENATAASEQLLPIQALDLSAAPHLQHAFEAGSMPSWDGDFGYMPEPADEPATGADPLQPVPVACEPPRTPKEAPPADLRLRACLKGNGQASASHHAKLAPSQAGGPPHQSGDTPAAAADNLGAMGSHPPVAAADAAGRDLPASNSLIVNSSNALGPAASAVAAPAAVPAAGSDGTAHMVNVLQQFLSAVQAQQQQQSRRPSAARFESGKQPTSSPHPLHVTGDAPSFAAHAHSRDSEEESQRPGDGDGQSQAQTFPMPAGASYPTLSISLQGGGAAEPTVMQLQLGPSSDPAPPEPAEPAGPEGTHPTQSSGAAASQVYPGRVPRPAAAAVACQSAQGAPASKPGDEVTISQPSEASLGPSASQPPNDPICAPAWPSASLPPSVPSSLPPLDPACAPAFQPEVDAPSGRPGYSAADVAEGRSLYPARHVPAAQPGCLAAGLEPAPALLMPRRMPRTSHTESAGPLQLLPTSLWRSSYQSQSQTAAAHWPGQEPRAPHHPSVGLPGAAGVDGSSKEAGGPRGNSRTGEVEPGSSLSDAAKRQKAALNRLSGEEQCPLELLAAASHMADSGDESDQDAHAHPS